MNKKLLIINQALNLSFLRMMEKLASEFGESVLITGSYPDSVNGRLKIVHAPSHNSASIVSRFKSWVRFILFSLNWIRESKLSFDLVFVVTNPPIAPFLALYFKKVKKWPYIILVWDIYPNVVERLKHFKIFKPLFILWKWGNGKVYKNADVIITLGEKMALSIKNQVPKIKFNIKIIPNWSDPERIRPIPKKENWFAQRYRLVNKFVVLYSGKMGLGHDINTILKTAKLLSNNKDIIFLFIGHGQGYSIVQNFIKKENVSNVLLLPLQSEEDFPFSIAAGDIGIVSQEKGMEKLFMPSKIYDMMAAGLAIIGISNGENDLKDTIERYRIGINVPSGDANKLAKNILSLKNNTKSLFLYKSNSRQSVVKYFRTKEIYKMFQKQFNTVFDNSFDKKEINNEES